MQTQNLTKFHFSPRALTFALLLFASLVKADPYVLKSGVSLHLMTDDVAKCEGENGKTVNCATFKDKGTLAAGSKIDIPHQYIAMSSDGKTIDDKKTIQNWMDAQEGDVGVFDGKKQDGFNRVTILEAAPGSTWDGGKSHRVWIHLDSILHPRAAAGSTPSAPPASADKKTPPSLVSDQSTDTASAKPRPPPTEASDADKKKTEGSVCATCPTSTTPKPQKLPADKKKEDQAKAKPKQDDSDYKGIELGQYKICDQFETDRSRAASGAHDFTGLVRQTFIDASKNTGNAKLNENVMSLFDADFSDRAEGNNGYNICPNFKKLDKDNQIKVFTFLLGALAHEENGCKEMETDKGDQTASNPSDDKLNMGLFGLPRSDKMRGLEYDKRGNKKSTLWPGCDVPLENFVPEKQIQCALTIMGNEVRKSSTKTLFTKDEHFGTFHRAFIDQIAPHVKAKNHKLGQIAGYFLVRKDMRDLCGTTHVQPK